MDISRDGITVDISRDGITVDISRDGITVDISRDGITVDISRDGITVDISRDGITLDISRDGITVDISTDGITVDISRVLGTLGMSWEYWSKPGQHWKADRGSEVKIILRIEEKMERVQKLNSLLTRLLNKPNNSIL